jgi:thiol-disulfide isomerase/thioredoxin
LYVLLYFLSLCRSWCGWCKKLEPTWNELAATVKDVNVGKIECIENPLVCQKLAIPGFPSLKLFADGKVYTYNGGNREVNREKKRKRKEGAERKTQKLTTLLTFVNGEYKNVTPEPNPFLKDAAPALVAEEEGHDEIVLTQQNFFDRIGSGRWLVVATGWKPCDFVVCF